jgi:hypothetical protein
MQKSFFVRRLSFAVSSILLVTCYLLLITSAPVFAQCPLDPAAPPGTIAVLCGGSGILQIQQLVTRLINISVNIAFMALTVWLVWGALKFFITSGGDPKALAQAWSSVTWAFMGIFFLVLAYLVMKLIFAATGAPVTAFCLGFPPYCGDALVPLP